jgi:hypothetical protein
MTTVVLDAAGEDGEFQYFNGVAGIATTGSSFRSAYARCGLQTYSLGNNVFMRRPWATGPQSSGWSTARACLSNDNGDAPQPMWGLYSADGVLRFYIEQGASGHPSQNWNVYIKSAEGAVTQLGSFASGFSLNPPIPDKIDCNWNIADGFSFYINKALVCSYSGSLATDSITQFVGSHHAGWETQTEVVTWSEVALLSGDSRDYTQATNAATAAGTLDQWTGAYTNVNKVQVNDGTFDTTTVSGNVQRYLMGQIATGNFNVIAKVTSLRNTQGGGALGHLSLAELINGEPYTAGPVAFNSSLSPTTFIQATNPATGLPWTLADINNTARESGYEATT